MLSTLNTIVNTQCTSLLVFEYEADYKLHNDENLEVYYIDTSKIEHLLDPDSQYSAEAMTDSGFKVILVDSYDEGLLSIRRRTIQQQEADFIPGGDFPAETFERSLDKLTMMVQELREKLDRAITSPLMEEPTDMVLPDSEDRANLYLSFDSDGDIQVTSGTGADGDTIRAVGVPIDDINNNYIGTEVEAALRETAEKILFSKVSYVFEGVEERDAFFVDNPGLLIEDAFIIIKNTSPPPTPGSRSYNFSIPYNSQYKLTAL